MMRLTSWCRYLDSQSGGPADHCMVIDVWWCLQFCQGCGARFENVSSLSVDDEEYEIEEAQR